MAALSKAPHPWKPVRSPSDRRPACPHGDASVRHRRRCQATAQRRDRPLRQSPGARRPPCADLASRYLASTLSASRRPGWATAPMASDTLAKISNRECRPVRRRTVAIMGEGAASRRTPPSGRARAGPDQHGQPARITESHPGQIDDDPAGMRPRQANEPLAQDGYGRDVDFAADRHDGVTTLTPDGKLRARRDMIDFLRRHLRQPISVPGGTGWSSPRATLTCCRRAGSPGPTQVTLRNLSGP